MYEKMKMTVMKILGPVIQYFPYFSGEDSKSLLHWSYQLAPEVLPSTAVTGLLWKPVGFERFLSFSFQDSQFCKVFFAVNELKKSYFFTNTVHYLK